MPLVTTLATSDTFRSWLGRTNTVINLINSNTVVVGGEAIGAFTIGNTTDTTSSLTIAGGKSVANLSGLFLTGNTTAGANVTVNSSSLLFTISSNATLLQSVGGTFVNASALTVNSTATVYGAIVGNSTLALAQTASFSQNVSVANNLVASNTVYSRALLFSETGAVVSDTLSSSSYNNYTVSGLADAAVLHANPNVQDISITGLTAPTNLSTGAKVFYVQNLSATYKITLKDESASSTAANRFTNPGAADVDILPNSSIPLIYSTATARWRVLASSGTSVTTLTVAGYVNARSTLQVAGVSTLSANLAVDTNVLIVDATNNRVGINTLSPTVALDVTGNAAFSTVLSIGGAANALSTLGVTGAANVLSTFGSTGAANLLSTLGVTGAANVLSTFGVTGAANLLSTLGVTGAANVLSTFGATGAANLLSTLGVTGATTLSSTLLVTGVATINNRMNFDGTNNGRLVLPVGTNKWAT